MTRWLRFAESGAVGFGTLAEDGMIDVHSGDLFAQPTPTGRRVALAAVELLTPTQPSKMLALWNNFHALADKLGTARPEHPLYFAKTANSFLASGQSVRRPKSYGGRIVYEGELGIVIGQRCAAVDEAGADACIFGYTCINDFTALELITQDPSFPQWVRAKSFDGFGAFGPVIASGLEPQGLSVRTLVNGKERQNYPVSDMILPPRRIVSLISHDMTLMPGDVICCGTSLGVLPLRGPLCTVEVVIDGIGTLTNRFEE